LTGYEWSYCFANFASEHSVVSEIAISVQKIRSRVSLSELDPIQSCGEASITVGDSHRIETRNQSEEDGSFLAFASVKMFRMYWLVDFLHSGDVIYSDELNHASIIDGCRLSKAQVRVYPHKDTRKLETMLKEDETARNKTIISDAVFSMEGDIAPVPRLVEPAEPLQNMVHRRKAPL